MELCRRPASFQGVTGAFEIGERYERPAGEPESWFHDALQQVMSERDGSIPIRVEAADGRHRVDGYLEPPPEGIPPGPHGKVCINSHGESLVIGSEKVGAFILLPDPPADRG
jgi:hypothetical protein